MPTASLPFALPADLGVSASNFVDNIYTDDGTGYDFALDGVPYVSGVGKDAILERATVLSQRNRQDNSTEPGEHVLTDWWVKAQSSFHFGAGQLYLDSNADSQNTAGFRFFSSRGLDCWTPGQLRMLPQTVATTYLSSATGLRGACLATSTGRNLLVYATSSDSALHYVIEQQNTTAGGQKTSFVVSHNTVNNAAGAVTASWDVATDGTSLFFVDNNGVWRSPLSSLGGTVPTKIYNFTATTTGARMKWVKQRLLLCLTDATNGSRVYELNSNTGAGTALPTPKFTHPNIAWAWTDIAEGPNAIYVSGYSGASSAIHKFVLDTSGVVPTLTTGITAVELPLGEFAFGMIGYAGVFGLTTNQGFRVCQYVNSSDIALGGLTVKQANTNGGTAGNGKFLYTVAVTAEGYTRCYRVDPTQQTDNSVCAYAEDVGNSVTTYGQAKMVMSWGGNRVIVLTDSGFLIQDYEIPEATGSLITSRVRFDTLEKKRARFARLRFDSTSARGQVKMGLGYDSQTAFHDVTTLASAQGIDSGSVITYASDSGFYAAQFSFTADTIGGNTQGPIMSGYQLKVIPAAFVSTRSKVPLLCFDEEETRNGGTIYRASLARLKALEAIQSTGRVIRFQVLAPDPTHSLSEFVVVESVDYVQVSAPDDDTAFGGIVTVTVRSIG